MLKFIENEMYKLEEGENFWDWEMLFDNQIFSSVQEALESNSERAKEYAEKTSRSGQYIYRELRKLYKNVKEKKPHEALKNIECISSEEMEYGADPLAQELYSLLLEEFPEENLEW
ncbi:MAG: hypothetical protein N3A54_02490 [Patescibacteria group bacterium]|nr:hypothetical protein [Patescibacteria group bacterium]